MTNTLEENLPVAPIVVSVLPASGLKLELKANEEERAAIAEFADILAVKSLVAGLKFARWHKDGVKVTGSINAQLEQRCAITLEPLETRINETFEALFVPEGSHLARPETSTDGEWVLDPDGADIPDTFVGDELDAWAIVLEHLQLFIDPFVRIEGAQLQYSQNDPAGSPQEIDTPEEKASPFAVLKTMKSTKRD